MYKKLFSLVFISFSVFAMHGPIMDVKQHLDFISEDARVSSLQDTGLGAVVQEEMVEKITSQKFTLQWGAAWRQGRRGNMQDAHVVNAQASQSSVFGIFDGHGYHGQIDPVSGMIIPAQEARRGVAITNTGLKVAQFAAQHFAPTLQSFLAKKISYQQALPAVFAQLDAGLKKHPYAQYGGATAAVVAIESGVAHIAWAGDSRVIIARGDGSIKAHTIDHVWTKESEVDRAAAKGATITQRPGGSPRVVGYEPSRAFGDFAGKVASNGAIISDPELGYVPLAVGDIIVIACDGVFEFDSRTRRETLTNQEVIDLVNSDGIVGTQFEARKDHGSAGKLATAAKRIRDKAYEKESADNISVIVIKVQ